MSDQLNNPGTPPTESEQYLWDGTGPFDPGVAPFERAAAGLRAGAMRPPTYARVARARLLKSGGILVAAALLIVGAGWLIRTWPMGLPSTGIVRGPAPAPPMGFWSLTSSAGVSNVSTVMARDGSQSNTCQIPDSAGFMTFVSFDGASIHVKGPGAVTYASGLGNSPVRLDAGVAAIDTRKVSVDTVVDVTAVRITIAPESEALVIAGLAEPSRITLKRGEACLTENGRETRLVGGMQAPIGEDRTPLRDNASPKFAEAIALADELRAKGFEGKWKTDPVKDAVDLSDDADAATLWNLLYAVNESRRPMVAGRLITMVGLKDEKVYKAAVALDRSIMDELWNRIVELHAKQEQRQRGQ